MSEHAASAAPAARMGEDDFEVVRREEDLRSPRTSDLASPPASVGLQQQASGEMASQDGSKSKSYSAGNRSRFAASTEINSRNSRPNATGSGKVFWLDDPTPQIPQIWPNLVKMLQAGDLLIVALAWKFGARFTAITAAARLACHGFLQHQTLAASKGAPVVVENREGLAAGIWSGFSTLQWMLHRLARRWGQRGFLQLLALTLGHAQLAAWAMNDPQSILGQVVRAKLMAARTLFVMALRAARLEGTPVLPKPSFPRQPAEVDAAWVSKAVGANVVELTTAPLFSVEASDDEDESFAKDEEPVPRASLSNAARLTVRFSDAAKANAQQLPTSFVVKMSTTDVWGKLKLRPLCGYQRETYFYDTVAPRVQDFATKMDKPFLEVPRCFKADFDRLSGDACFLFEDAKPLQPGCEIDGASWQEACSVASRYARFHAVHWRPSEEVLDDDFGLHWHAAFDAFKTLHPLFMNYQADSGFQSLMKKPEFANLVSPESQRSIRAFIDHLDIVLDELMEGPMTVIHGNARKENMLWPAAVEGIKEDQVCHSGLKFDNAYDRRKVRWLSAEWQSSSKGKGIYDLATFVGLDLDTAPDAGDTCDRVLVSEYVKSLSEALGDAKRLGGYTSETCWRDYRLSMFLAAMTPIFATPPASLSATAQAQFQCSRECMLRRVVKALERIDASEVLYEVIQRRAHGKNLNGVLTTYRHVEDKMLERDRAGIALPGDRPSDAPVVIRSATPYDEPLAHFSPKSLLNLKDGADIPAGEGRRDVYDRWFLNGYDSEGKVFFATALGFYPARRVMDASFSVIVEGVQHNVRVSRKLTEQEWPSHIDANEAPTRVTMDSAVGPIRITIKRPLQVAQLDVTVPGKVEASLTMKARFEPVMEPPYANNIRGIGEFAYERFTQLVGWDGLILVDGSQKIVVNDWWGTRDRSWGRRPHLQADKGAKRNQQRNLVVSNRLARYAINQACRPLAQTLPQFYWFWTPINVPNGGFTYHSQQTEDGTVENGAAHIFGDPFGPEHAPYGKVEAAGHSLEYQTNGTRHFQTCTVIMVLQDGRRVTVQFEPIRPFFMSGIGYSHDSMAHGMAHGPDLLVQCDKLSTEMANRMEPLSWHIQEVSNVRCALYGRDAGPEDAPLAVASGISGAEQLVIGPHTPSGFTSVMDA